MLLSEAQCAVSNRIFRCRMASRVLMIDATHLKAHRIGAGLLKKANVPRRIGRTKGGLNSKLHAVCDGHGRPLILLLSEGGSRTGESARDNDRCAHAFCSSICIAAAVIFWL
jgi:transposase